MRVDFCIIKTDRPDVVERARNPEGFSKYRRDRISSLKPFASKCLSAAAGIACEIGFAKFGLKESELEYEFNEFGKPSVKGHPEIVFNVSHSGEYAVAAFLITERPDGAYQIGVDIERIARVKPVIASKMKGDTGFDGTEVITGETVGEDARHNAMTDLCRRWTAREAFVKCIGTGISSFDENFHFEKTPSGYIRLCQNIYDGEFSLIEADAPAGYRITCVVRENL